MAVMYLADTSAFARTREPSVGARISALADQLALCEVVVFELGTTARNDEEYDRLMTDLRAYPWAPIDDGVWEAARSTQRALVRGGLHRTVRMPDLIIAAAAAAAELTVLHYDRDFDRIAAVTGQPVEWVVPAGSL